MDRTISDWIIGTDPDNEREYIVHSIAPRFIARVFLSEDESMTDDEEISEGAGQSKLFTRDDEEYEISVMRWDDPPPTDSAIGLLLMEAAAALAICDEASEILAYQQAVEPMTPEELEQCGRVIAGSQWQTPLARRMGVEPRLVRYWLAGKREIPHERAHVIRGWAMRAIRDNGRA